MNTSDKSRRAALQTLMAAGAACGLLAATGAARAQEWPTRPVHLVIGVGAGSASDTMARMIGARLQTLWKQPVIVENKPGAGAAVAAEYVAGATDQHTLLIGSLSTLLPKFTTRNLRYDPLTDLLPVYRLVNYQLVIVTNAATAQKAGTLREIAALSKSTPQGLFFAGLGRAAIFNLAMALVNQGIGIRYADVNFKDVSAMNLALLRNDAQLVINTPSSFQAQLDSGELRAVAAMNATRYQNLPNVPTLQEAAGYTGFIPLSWGAVFAPKGTSNAIVERVSRDLLTVLSDPEFKNQIETRVTGTVLRSSPAEFAKEYREEAVVWKDLFEKLEIKPE